MLAFSGAPLEQPLDLAGPVAVARGDGETAPTSDLFVKLLDVAPDRRGRGCCCTAPRPCRAMTPAVPVTAPGWAGQAAELYLGHTAYRVRPGHRLRLAVACS